MRKIKFLTAMALLVFVFSGCGGSASSDSEDSGTTESTLHQQVKAFLEGGWVIDMDFPLSGTIQNSTTYTYSYLKNVQNTTFKMVISDVTFLSSADTATGSATVYYYFESPVYASISTGNSSGNFYFKSYTTGASTKTQKMTITRDLSDTRWRLRASAFDMIVTIPSFSSEKMTVFLDDGIGNVANVTGSYTCDNIECTLTKTPDTDYIEDNSDGTGSDTVDILEGTWLFSTGGTTGETEEAKAYFNDGSQGTLTLKLASDVNLNISNITLAANESGTGLTGTVDVTYAQKWTAYDTSSQMQGQEGSFAFDKDETMKIIKVADGLWRIEDTANSNENIIITINSSTEIQTVWTGTKNFLGKKCTYSITCLFRKQ